MAILIAHSRTDALVNIQSAWQNYNALKRAGFSQVYLYELPQGQHPCNAEDLDYQKVLQSFYKHHGFQYDAQLATFTKQELQTLQPSIEEIDEKLQTNQWVLRKQTIINSCIIAAAALCFANRDIIKNLVRTACTITSS